MSEPRQVPAYDAHAFRPKAHDYCVCTFVLNEDGRLHAQLDRMRPFADVADVVIADGGSTDGSVSPAALEPRGVNTLLVKTGAGELGAQMRMAFSWAMDRGYRGVIAIDGNNKDDPAALPLFVHALEEGADHVQGSRYIPGGLEENTPLSRRLGVKLVHAPLISLAAGFRYTDTTNGFRAYSGRFLVDPRVGLFRDVFVGYELHYYLAIRAARLGFTVREIPVTRRYPSKGPVPTKLSPLRGNLTVIKCLLSACLGHYDLE
jgi:dolichol-phosphate mannosyltransferase